MKRSMDPFAKGRHALLHGLITACAVCFGSTEPGMTYVLLGMLVLPFLMVGGMFTFLYAKGVFRNPGRESDPASVPSKRT